MQFFIAVRWERNFTKALYPILVALKSLPALCFMEKYAYKIYCTASSCIFPMCRCCVCVQQTDVHIQKTRNVDASVLHSEMAPDLLKVRPTMNLRSLLTLEVSGVPYVLLRGDHIQPGPQHTATVPLWPSLLCIIPPPPGNTFQSELLFFRPSFILLNQTLCLSLLLYLPPVSMVTSLSALYTIYLFLRFPLCLSHSVLIFLILLSSLPPFLLLYPTPSSLQLLSLFTFICLSPFSPLQACHSIMLVLVLTYREKVLSVSLSTLHF